MPCQRRLAECQADAPLDRSEKEWLTWLAQRELNLAPWERPTLAQLIALAKERNVNVGRVLR